MASNQRVDTVVFGGQVVTSSEAYEAGVAIKDEKIVAIGPSEVLPPAENYIDATGKYVLPGAIDAHVHLAGHDDYEVGAWAAAHAGLTTLVPFAVTDQERRESLPHSIERHKEMVRKQSVLDFGLHFMLGNQEYLLDGLPEALDMGVSSYKMFMTYKKQVTRMVSDEFICRAMEIISAKSGVCQLHCENGDVANYLEDWCISQEAVHPRNFPGTCPPWIEAEAINRAINFGALTRCLTYVVHLSTQGGLERIKQAQAQGLPVWTETCPQYLLLDNSLMEEWGPLAKMGPPLRDKDGPDQPALWGGLQQGFISIVASDHAPHDPDQKQHGWNNVFVQPDGRVVPYGSPGVETIVPLMYSQGVVDHGLPIWWMARILAENPARIFGLYPRKGVIRVGADADLLIIDPNQQGAISAKNHHGNSGYTLFEGWEVKGWPWMTLQRGRVLLQDGQVQQQPGAGQFIPAGATRPPIGGRVG